MKKLFIIAFLLCAYLQSSAYEWTDSNGVIWSFSVSGSEVIITGSSKNNGDLVIPSKVYINETEYNVTSIGDHAFNLMGYYNLTSVTIGNGVVSIGDGAFNGLPLLTSVDIPSTVTSIGVDAFKNCSGLTSVNIHDLAAWCNISFNGYIWGSNPLCIARNLYLNGEVINDLVIPEGVETIANSLFCNAIFNSVTIPNSVTSIGREAFAYCSMTSVDIPKSYHIHR
jgi:hypothetical protein